MKPVDFEYVRACDLDSALAALRDGGDASRSIAGGQSLGPMLNLRLARPTLLVDIGRIPRLRRVECKGDAWHLGAGVTHAMVEDGVGGLGGMLPAVARGIAYRAVRNRGTMGGSLAHADPAADWALALTALDARVFAQRANDTREIPVVSLSVGAFSTSLAPDELLTEIRVPALSASVRWGFVKACRKAGEFADAAAAVVIDPSRRYARVAIGALGGPPLLLEDAHLLVEQAAPSLEFLAQVVSQAVPGLDKVDVRLQAATLHRALAQARTSR